MTINARYHERQIKKRLGNIPQIRNTKYQEQNIGIITWNDQYVRHNGFYIDIKKILRQMLKINYLERNITRGCKTSKRI